MVLNIARYHFFKVFKSLRYQITCVNRHDDTCLLPEHKLRFTRHKVNHPCKLPWWQMQIGWTCIMRFIKRLLNRNFHSHKVLQSKQILKPRVQQFWTMKALPEMHKSLNHRPLIHSLVISLSEWKDTSADSLYKCEKGKMVKGRQETKRNKKNQPIWALL